MKPQYEMKKRSLRKLLRNVQKIDVMDQVRWHIRNNLYNQCDTDVTGDVQYDTMSADDLEIEILQAHQAWSVFILCSLSSLQVAVMKMMMWKPIP